LCHLHGLGVTHFVLVSPTWFWVTYLALGVTRLALVAPTHGSGVTYLVLVSPTWPLVSTAWS